MKKELKINNVFGEELDVLVEGNTDADTIVVFMHGFGTDKGEGHHLFAELAGVLGAEHLTIRFDQSGYGKSQGKSEEFQMQKAAGDLDSILRWARREYPSKTLNILAHSLGTFITALLSPEHIHKAVFTGAINLDLKTIARKIAERIESKGGTVDRGGITIYPRTSGAVQKIGKDFWRVLEANDLPLYLAEFAQKTDLLVIKSLQDEIVGGGDSFDAYKHIPKLQYEEVQGDHNFSGEVERQEVFKRISDFFEQN